MAIKSNIPEIIEKLERIKAALSGTDGLSPAITEAMYTALNAGMEKMKFRIFNKGLDAEGNSLGNYQGNKTRLTKKKYSIASDDEFDERDRKSAKGRLKKFVGGETYTEYEKFRLSKGLQIGYKDLEVEGSLRRSIQTVKVDNSQVVVAITNEETAKIASYQEQQIGNIRSGQNAKTGTSEPAKIFTISQEEYDLIKAEGNEAIRQIIRKIINEA